MKKTMAKVVNFQEYKDKKKHLEVNRKELLELIKQIVTTKQEVECPHIQDFVYYVYRKYTPFKNNILFFS